MKGAAQSGWEAVAGRLATRKGEIIRHLVPRKGQQVYL